MSEFAAYRRGTIMGQKRSGLTMGPEIFEAIENYIKQCERIRRRYPGAMDLLVRVLAMVHVGYAQTYAQGPVDQRNQRPELAWKLPVRRITGRYYFGWKVKRVTRGVWQVYNDSREAFFIEYGIHRNPHTGQVSPRRIRRPINKLAIKRTLQFAAKSAVADRVWASLHFPPPPERKGKGFLWTMQSSATLNAPFPKFFGQTSVPLSGTLPLP